MKANSPPPRPAVWPVLLAYLAAFVLTLLAGAVVVGAVALARVPRTPMRVAEEAARFALSAPGLIAVASVDALVLLAVAIGMARLTGSPVAATLRLGPAHASALGFGAALLGVIGLSFTCGAAIHLLGAGRGGVMDILARELRSLSPPLFAVAIVAIGIAPGIAEETFFRGLMQTRFTASWGRWPAIVATSAAFALIHLDGIQSSAAFVAGLFLGWIADRFSSIRPTIFAHALNNALFVLIAWFASSANTGRRADVVTLGGGAIAWLASTLVLRSPAALRAQSVNAREAPAVARR